MPKIFTTPEAAAKAKRQMRYILIAGGLRSKDPNEDLPYNFNYSQYLDSAKVVCDELVNRDFTNIDSALNTLRSYAPVFNGEARYKAEGFAKAIVYLAELLELYWDDTLKTPYEVDEFKKTKLGEAVYKYGRYISAIQDKSTRTPRSASSTSTGGAGSSAHDSLGSSGFAGSVRFRLLLYGSGSAYSRDYHVPGSSSLWCRSFGRYGKPLGSHLPGQGLR